MLVKLYGPFRREGRRTIPVFCRKCGRAIKVAKVKHGDRDEHGRIPTQPTSGIALCGHCMRK